MKKIITLICVAAMICTLVLSATALIVVGYNNVDQLINGHYRPELGEYGYTHTHQPGADIIVVGTAVSKVTTQLNTAIDGSALDYTITTIKVTEVMRGDVKVGDLIDVRGLRTVETADYEDSFFFGPFFEMEKSYLFFLWELRYDYEEWTSVLYQPRSSIRLDSEGNISTDYLSVATELGIFSIGIVRELVTGEYELPVTIATPATTSTNSDSNPPTGVALVGIPALFAGGVMLISKRRNNKP